MIKREFKNNFKSLIIWACIISAIFILVFTIYPSIMNSGNASALEDIMAIFPKELLEMFNMDIISINSVFGWMQTEGVLFLLLLGSIYSAILGATILVKEENDKTIEYLYSKPVKRRQIITAKVIVGIINIFLFTLIITIVNAVGLVLSNEFTLKPFLLFSCPPLIIFYVFFFVSLFISTFAKKTKKMMTLAIALVFISYFFQLIGNMADVVKFFKYFSIFELAPTRTIILNEGLDFIRILLAIIITTITLLLTYINYQRKELVN